MAAYLISEVTPLDADAFATYRDRAAASIKEHGGRYIIRGGTIETIEGQFDRKALVVVEFPDLETAHLWYRSSNYAKALEVRDKALTRNLFLVEGIASEQA